MSVNHLTLEQWIATLGVIVALIIGIIQILKKNKAKSGNINIKQHNGALSKSKQNINIKIDQSDNHE